MKKDIYITDYNCVTPLGFDIDSNWNALIEGKSGVASHRIAEHQEAFYTSMIDSPTLEERFFKTFGQDQNHQLPFTRLEKMLLLSLKPLIEKHNITENTAFILSTTKGNISLLKNQSDVPEGAYLSSMAKKIADFFGFTTKPIVVSNACVSGVMAIAVAKNMIRGENIKMPLWWGMNFLNLLFQDSIRSRLLLPGLVSLMIKTETGSISGSCSSCLYYFRSFRKRKIQI